MELVGIGTELARDRIKPGSPRINLVPLGMELIGVSLRLVTTRLQPGLPSLILVPLSLMVDSYRTKARVASMGLCLGFRSGASKCKTQTHASEPDTMLVR